MLDYGASEAVLPMAVQEVNISIGHLSLAHPLLKESLGMNVSPRERTNLRQQSFLLALSTLSN